MPAATGSTSHRFLLEGDWVLENVDRHRKQLADALAQLLQSPQPECQVELDLARMTDIDACGCQLLALFLMGLGRQGVTPRLQDMPGELREKLVLLGYDDVLAGGEPTGDEAR
ncbi:STAS domain-containing protein [Geomonas sp.]|uniref:STAS domain-containing protein n=1 Tax=Geomonas sp. TaxID=2651584 RepID=UPI002B4A4573|nr:STAS domain-containing protein [Geomonas sp.]HJV35007.1 STAS domain-containing protein [Geomonas sp.]